MEQGDIMMILQKYTEYDWVVYRELYLYYPLLSWLNMPAELFFLVSLVIALSFAFLRAQVHLGWKRKH